MSVHEQINLLKSTTCFSKMSTFYSEQKYKYQKSFHDSIKNSKDSVYNLFEKEPLYRELMPVISKSKRGNVYYNQLVKKNLKNKERKSVFYENLMRVIKEVQKKNEKKEKVAKQPKSTNKHLFMIPKIDILRKKRDKIESYLLKKYKTCDDEIKTLKKSWSTLSQFKLLNKEDSQNNFFKYFNNPQTNNMNINNITNTSKENDQIMSLETLHTFNQLNDGSMRNNLKEKSFNLTKFSIVTQPKRAYHSTAKRFTRKSIDLSEYFQKQERFMYQKQKKLTKILKICKENISQGKFVEEDIHNISKQTDPFSIQNKLKNAMQSDDKKIIEDLGKGSKKYQEYKKIQEEKFNNLKKNVDLKISDEYAYIIKKDLQTNFGVNGTVLPYELYQKDMSKIKEKIDNDLLTEKKNIKKVKQLLDDVYRKKEFLKYKIDIYKTKQDKFNEVKNVNFKKKGEYESHNYENEDVKGNLLPKLIEMRDQCHGGVDYDLDKE